MADSKNPDAPKTSKTDWQGVALASPDAATFMSATRVTEDEGIALNNKLDPRLYWALINAARGENDKYTTVNKDSQLVLKKSAVPNAVSIALAQYVGLDASMFVRVVTTRTSAVAKQVTEFQQLFQALISSGAVDTSKLDPAVVARLQAIGAPGGSDS